MPTSFVCNCNAAMQTTTQTATQTSVYVPPRQIVWTRPFATFSHADLCGWLDTQLAETGASNRILCEVRRLGLNGRELVLSATTKRLFDDVFHRLSLSDVELLWMIMTKQSVHYFYVDQQQPHGEQVLENVTVFRRTTGNATHAPTNRRTIPPVAARQWQQQTPLRAPVTHNNNDNNSDNATTTQGRSSPCTGMTAASSVPTAKQMSNVQVSGAQMPIAKPSQTAAAAAAGGLPMISGVVNGWAAFKSELKRAARAHRRRQVLRMSRAEDFEHVCAATRHANAALVNITRALVSMKN